MDRWTDRLIPVYPENIITTAFHGKWLNTSNLTDWLIVWCLTLFSTLFQLYHGSQCTYPCFPVGPLSSTPHNILSKPLAAFEYNHCRNNRQRWERKQFDWNKSSFRGSWPNNSLPTGTKWLMTASFTTTLHVQCIHKVAMQQKQNCRRWLYFVHRMTDR